MIAFSHLAIKEKKKKYINLNAQNQKVWSVKYNLKESSKEHTNSSI